MTEQQEFLFKIDVKTLLDIARTIKEFVTEVRFNVNNEGLEIIEIEPGNCCLVSIKLDKSRFIQLTEESEVKTYGLDTPTLYDILKEHKKENVNITTQNNKIYLEFDNGINSEISLIDMKEEKQKMPELEFKAEITIDSKRLKEILKHFCSNSESVIFSSLNDGFKIYSEKGLNDSNIKLDIDEVKVNGEEIKCKFSTEFLSKFIKAIFSEKTTLKFDADSPLRFEQEEQGLEVIYILAPRVDYED